MKLKGEPRKLLKAIVAESTKWLHATVAVAEFPSWEGYRDLVTAGYLKQHEWRGKVYITPTEAARLELAPKTRKKS